MPDDQNNGQATGADKGTGEGHNEGGDQNKDTNKDTAGSENNDGGENKGGGGDDNKGAPKPPAEGSQNGDDDNKDDGKAPETRKRLSVQDHIIGRQHRKLSKQNKDKGNEGEGEDDDKGDEGDENDIAPEDEALINKVVTKTFAPILEKTISAEDDKEVATFIKENPDFAPFEAKARRYIADPSRRHLPIKTIFYEVAGDKLLKLGAERERKAQEKAKETQTGGGSNRSGEGEKSVWDLTPEEFAAEQEKVRRGLK